MRIPSFHLLTTTPAEMAEFWVTQAHELRMVGLKALNLPQLARRCDPLTGELLMALELLALLPVTQGETVLSDAIAAASAEWLPHWMRHIDLVTEMAIAMAKHREEQEGVFQTFIQALKALPNMPPFQDETVMQAASERARSLLEEREWEQGKLWCVRKVPSRELPWILADASWEKQLDDAMTFLHIWRVTHFIGIEFMAVGWAKPPDITCLPFPVDVLGVGFELETNLEILERFRVSQKKNLEQNFLLLADMLRGLRFDTSPYTLMMRISAVMPKPLDMSAVMRRIYKRREKRAVQVNETPANAEADSVQSGTDRDVNSHTQEKVDAMVADFSEEAIQEMAEMIDAAHEKFSGEAASDEKLPHPNFLTPEEIASLLEPVKKPKRKAAKRKQKT